MSTPDTLPMFPAGSTPALHPVVVVEVDGLELDGAQLRVGLDEATVERYAEKMRAIFDGSAEPDAKPFPPVVGFVEDVSAPDPDPRHIILADGFHRLEAARRVGRLLIGVELHQGSRFNAVLYACSANTEHGLPASAADRRRAVEALLGDPKGAEWSDREIARRAGVSARTVGRIRREMGAELDTRRFIRSGVEGVQRVCMADERPFDSEVADLFGGAPTCGTAAGDEAPSAKSTPAVESRAPSISEMKRPAPRHYPAIIDAEEGLNAHQRHILRRWAFTHGWLEGEPSCSRLSTLPHDLDVCADGRAFEDLDHRLLQLTEGDDAPLERLESGRLRLAVGLTTYYAHADRRLVSTRERQNDWVRRHLGELVEELGAHAFEMQLPGHGPRVIRIHLTDDPDGAEIYASNYPESFGPGAEWETTLNKIERACAELRAARVNARIGAPPRGVGR